MPLFNPPLNVQDHGVDQGTVETINFTGSTSVSVTDSVATINVSGGGTSSINQVEIDFGLIPTRSKTFVVPDASVSVSSRILPLQSGEAATGRDADENEMDPVLFSAIPGIGQFILIGSSLNGPVAGKFKVNYSVGN